MTREGSGRWRMICWTNATSSVTKTPGMISWSPRPASVWSTMSEPGTGPPQMQRLVPLKTFLENLPGQIRDQRVDRLVQDQSHGSVLVVIEHQDHGPSKNRSVELRGGDEKMTIEGLHVFARQLR